jgi:phytoene dehydrogenase-like protein
LLGTPFGPYAAGTAANLLLGFGLAKPGVRGGTTAFLREVLKASRDFGVRVQLRSAVQRIMIEQGKVTGVELANGDVIVSSRVLSTADPKRTFFDLIEPRERPPEIADLWHWRSKGNLAVVHYALSGPPCFRRHPGLVFAKSAIVSDMEALEASARSVKYGELPETLPLHLSVPTVEDPTLAPNNHHVLTVLATPIPHLSEAEWTAEKRDALKNRVREQLADAMPGFRSLIVAEQWLLPHDLEREYGMTGGHIFHGDLTLDQFNFLRPHPRLSAGLTPIEGLYLAGPGLHPGGQFPGMSGCITAKSMR